jgi:hypothetical protein
MGSVTLVHPEDTFAVRGQQVLETGFNPQSLSLFIFREFVTVLSDEFSVEELSSNRNIHMGESFEVQGRLEKMGKECL